MVPDPRTDDPDVIRNDGGLDEERLYFVVREAMKDALLDVAGTFLLVGVAFVLVWAGVTAAFRGQGSPAAAGFGLFVALCGVYLAAATLEVIPPIREWL